MDAGSDVSPLETLPVPSELALHGSPRLESPGVKAVARKESAGSSETKTKEMSTARLGADGEGWAVEVGGKDEADIAYTVAEGGGAGSSQSVALGTLFEIFGFEPNGCSVVLNVASTKSTSDQLLTASEPSGNKA